MRRDWVSSDIKDGMAAHAHANPTGSRILQQVSSKTKISTSARKRDFTVHKDQADEISYPPNTKRAGQSVNDTRETDLRKQNSTQSTRHIEDENNTNRLEQSNRIDPQAEERAFAENDDKSPFMPGHDSDERLEPTSSFLKTWINQYRSLQSQLSNFTKHVNLIGDWRNSKDCTTIAAAEHHFLFCLRIWKSVTGGRYALRILHDPLGLLHDAVRFL